MTPERKETTKLKKGDRVVMHTCIEAETHNGRIWTCSSDQFTRGTGALAQDSVFLEGFSGSFAPEFLQKVTLPTEDERLLAALEEAEQRNIDLMKESGRESFNRSQQLADKKRELTEAQQTIARQREATLEQQLLEMWDAAGIAEIYKYKNRIYVFKRPGLTRCELFYDLTYGLFEDVYDTARDDHTTPEDAKKQVKELLVAREGAKEASPPACPKCGDKNVAEHPTQKDVYLCGACSRIFGAGVQP